MTFFRFYRLYRSFGFPILRAMRTAYRRMKT